MTTLIVRNLTDLVGDIGLRWPNMPADVRHREAAEIMGRAKAAGLAFGDDWLSFLADELE